MPASILFENTNVEVPVLYAGRYRARCSSIALTARSRLAPTEGLVVGANLLGFVQEGTFVGFRGAPEASFTSCRWTFDADIGAAIVGKVAMGTRGS